MGKPFVKIEIDNIEEYIASVVSAATADFITIGQAAYLINEGVKYEVAQAIASLQILVASNVSCTLQTQEVTGDAQVDGDVVYSNLDDELSIAKVALPLANNVKIIRFLAKKGGLEIVPNGYNLPQRNTIQGDTGLTIGVHEEASHIGSPLTASFVMKLVFRKYENVTLVSDGVDTWYVL